MSALMFIRRKRKVRELSEMLSVMALANSGNGKAIRDQLDSFERETNG